ncbi:hypothetical protein ACFL2J_02095 [Candidatus Omnitrophota bacterium]
MRINNNFIRGLILIFLILGVYPIDMEAAGGDSITITVTIKEVIPQIGVTIRVVPKSKKTRPAVTVSLRATIRNRGDADDYFTLTASSSLGWEVIFPQGDTLGPIEPGRRETVPVKVIVPVDATRGDRNTLTIAAASQFDPSVSDSGFSTITVR